MDRTSSERGHSSSTKQQSNKSTHSNNLATDHKTTATVPNSSANLIPQAFGAASPDFKHLFMDHCEFRPSPVEGYGVFASRDIEPGTEIIKEKALWVVDAATAVDATFSESDSDYHEARCNMIQSFFNTSCPDLDTEARQLLHNDMLSLSGGFDPEQQVDGSALECAQTLSQHIREILILNAATGGSRGRIEYAAVFQAFSRLNHSCAPNAVSSTFKLDDGSVWCIVHVTSPIKAGEEIFINYVDPLAKFDQRQESLRSRWRFTCTCRLCTRPKKETEASDDRRGKMEDAMEMMRSAQMNHAKPKPHWQKDAVYNSHLDQCDKVTIGEAGLEVLEKFAAKEGISDLRLFTSLTHAADAAERLRKLSLETGLVDRLVAVCRTYSMGARMTTSLTNRRERLRETAAAIIRIAELHVSK